MVVKTDRRKKKHSPEWREEKGDNSQNQVNLISTTATKNTMAPKYLNLNKIILPWSK